MFEIPVVLLLIPYAIFIFLYLFYAFFNVYHLLRFGVYGFHLYIVTAAFVGGSVLLMAASGFLLFDYDWSAMISLGDAILGTPETTNSDAFGL